ncbi:MAG: ParB/RepB/Spo0J family partition protein [Deltaproteobacteria bacterium]|nr:ParB/RepB/Spo0J family partition protein [Deltaproteobacteria bacterium]
MITSRIKRISDKGCIVQKKGLGRGLGALLSEGSSTGEEVQLLPLGEITANQAQPRKTWDEEGLRQLAESIKANGVLQPILVRPSDDGKYEIIAGERRWRASRLAEQASIPALIKTISNAEAMTLALIENIQREDLTAVEEARAMQRLRDEFGLTQEELSQKLGRSRSAIANALRMLNLPKKILDSVDSGQISAGHARAIVSLPGADDQERAMSIIIEKNLNVRDAERLVQNWSESKNHDEASLSTHDRILAKDIKTRLKSCFPEARSPKISFRGTADKGTISFKYKNPDELHELLELIQAQSR